jgi:hypothetical protein
MCKNRSSIMEQRSILGSTNSKTYQFSDGTGCSRVNIG